MLKFTSLDAREAQPRPNPQPPDEHDGDQMSP